MFLVQRVPRPLLDSTYIPMLQLGYERFYFKEEQEIPTLGSRVASCYCVNPLLKTDTDTKK